MDGEKTDSKEITAKMDTAAETAKTELQVTMTLPEVAAWFSKHYKTAGYKRLGRILAGYLTVPKPA